jgi:hypothetical protein
MSDAAIQSATEAGGSARSVLEREWPQIRALWKATQVGVFATVAPDGSPQITPIGSVYLDSHEPKGYFHPIFAARLRRALGDGGRFELLFVDLRARIWLPALIRGRFDRLVAARLRGRGIGARRPATEGEVARWQRQVRAVGWTRGHELLWSNVRYVQELSFDEHVPVRFGAMPHGKSEPARLVAS